MLSPHALKTAYIESRSSELEARIAEITGMNSIPVIGGVWSSISGGANRLWRPFKLTGAFLFGSGDAVASLPEPTPLPERWQGTSLGDSVTRYREEMRKVIAHDAESWASYASLNLVAAKQHNAAARHQEDIARKVTLPMEESASSALAPLATAGIAIASPELVRSLPSMSDIAPAIMAGTASLRPDAVPAIPAAPAQITHST